MQQEAVTHSQLDIPEWVKVGWVKDAHGLRGELYLATMSGELPWFDGLKQIHLRWADSEASSDSLQAFTLQASKPHKNGLIVRLQGIASRNEAEKIKGWQWYIPGELLVSDPGEEIYLGEILGFSVEVEGSSVVGEVVGFSSNGAQDLLVVKTDAGKFEVPFVEEFILKKDFSAKRLYLALPEGLIE